MWYLNIFSIAQFQYVIEKEVGVMRSRAALYILVVPRSPTFMNSHNHPQRYCMVLQSARCPEEQTREPSMADQKFSNLELVKACDK
jgi:hypothetical protein